MVYREVDSILEQFDNIENDYKRLLESISVITEGVDITKAHINIITEAESGIFSKLAKVVDDIKNKIKGKTNKIKEKNKKKMNKIIVFEGPNKKAKYDDLNKNLKNLDSLNVVIKDYKELSSIEDLDKKLFKLFDTLMELYDSKLKDIWDGFTVGTDEKVDDENYYNDILDKIESERNKFDLEKSVHKLFFLSEEDEHKLSKKDVENAISIVDKHERFIEDEIWYEIDEYTKSISTLPVTANKQCKDYIKGLGDPKDPDYNKYMKFIISGRDTLCKIARMEYETIIEFTNVFEKEDDEYLRCAYNYIKYAESALKYSNKES